ncbi:MAG: GNAT family acetyltransferase [Clostridia bacterium]|nr:GNAT family acetyltransferase [Clostridia bacterium]
MKYVLATMEDLPAIKALLARYHKDTIKPEDMPGGFVTTKLSDEQFEDLIVNQKGITLAKNDKGEVKAFAFHAPWDYWMQVPIMKRMTEVLPDMPFDGMDLDVSNTYQYGPVCVDVDVRNTGVFAEIFKEALKLYEDRYPVMVTFINQINPRSYAAHTKKAGMTEIGKFDFNDNHYWMMAIKTK